jgi:ankyrin repeat protein
VAISRLSKLYCISFSRKQTKSAFGRIWNGFVPISKFEGRSPLSWAAQHGSTDLAVLYLYDGAGPTGAEGLSSNFITPCITALRRLLKIAVVESHEELLETLLECGNEYGVEFEKANQEDTRLLPLAASHRNTALVHWLLFKGSDINATDGDGLTALMHAASQDIVPHARA